MRTFLLFVVAALLVYPMAAQQPGGQSADPNVSEQQPSGQSAEPNVSEPQPNESTGVEAASVVPAPAYISPWRAVLYYGADFTEREDFPEPESGGPSTIASFRGWLGVSRPKFVAVAGTSAVLEHSPQGTVVNVGADGFIGPRYSHIVVLSHRWSWDFILGLGYGADVARVFIIEPEGCEGIGCTESAPAEQGYVKMDGPSASADATAFGTSSGPALGETPILPRPDALVVRTVTPTAMTLGAYGSTGLSWQRTSWQRFSLRFSHDETSFLNGNPQANDGVSARALTAFALTQLTTMSVYGQVHHYLQDGGCTSYGGGVSVFHSMSEKTNWWAEAGPEYGTGACGQSLGLNFFGMLRSRISRSTSLAADGGRDLSASYLVGSRWANYVEGAVIQKTSARTSLSLSGGYLSSASEFQAGSSYTGYSAASLFRYQMNRQWDLLASYRYFRAMSESGRVGIIGIYLTLQWHPPAQKL